MVPDWKILDKMKSHKGEPLLQFQRDGVWQMLPRQHNLLADEMGLGKTVQAIALIDVLHLTKILIIAKASIKRGWEKKIYEWSTIKRSIQIIDKRTDFVSDLAEIVIINYDLLTHSYMFQQLKNEKWDIVICDEAHSLKNMKAKRTVAILSNNGLCRSAARTLMITGTPILNRPIEFFPILKVLAPLVIAPYSDYFRYAKRYCDGWQDGFGLNAKGASHTEELNQKLRKHYMIRRTVDEVEVQLPKERYEIVLIDSEKEVQDKLKVLNNPNRFDFKHQDLGITAGELATLRRETAEKKIEAAISLIKDYVESTDKIVLFAYHHSVIERLERELKDYGTVTLSGSTSQSNRERTLQSFTLQKAVKVFIGQIQAAGEGIDGLQGVCHNVVFIETSWVPGEIDQAIKRLKRMGQTKSVLVRFLVWANSVEEHMMRVALDKVKVIKEILK